MKIKAALVSLSLAFGLPVVWAADKETPVVLPTFVVQGFRIPSSWLEVSCECKGPLPYNLVKRAWISKVGHGTPAERAGMKVGDTVLAIGRDSVDVMTAASLHDTLIRDRDPGTQLEFILQTRDSEKRTVVIVFK